VFVISGLAENFSVSDAKFRMLSVCSQSGLFPSGILRAAFPITSRMQPDKAGRSSRSSIFSMLCKPYLLFVRSPIRSASLASLRQCMRSVRSQPFPVREIANKVHNNF